jgi:hypothetical protein
MARNCSGGGSSIWRGAQMRLTANPIRIGKTLAALTALATFCTPATSAESQRYTATVLEQIRSEITVEANEEYAARAMALLEARRTSRFGSPAWEPSPPAVVANARESEDFAAIKTEPLFPLAAPKIVASGGSKPDQSDQEPTRLSAPRPFPSAPRRFSHLNLPLKRGLV